MKSFLTHWPAWADGRIRFYFIRSLVQKAFHSYSYKNCILSFVSCCAFPFALWFRNFEGIGTRALYVQASDLQCGRLAQQVPSSRIHLKQYRRVFLLLISSTDLAAGHSRPNLYILHRGDNIAQTWGEPNWLRKHKLLILFYFPPLDKSFHCLENKWHKV